MQINYINFPFFSQCRRRSENPQSETRPHSSPDPSCEREISRGRKSIPPDKLFRPAESVLIIWILLEIVSNFVQQTPQIMKLYKHTQIGYLMLVVLLAVLVLFVWAHITARAEPPSYNSGSNFLITAVMALILLILASFATLSVSIDEKFLRVKFGYGIFRKKFLLSEIASAKQAKNHWYYGWGIRLRLWPKMWIYNVSGFDAVEIIMRNGKIYRIGTDTPDELEAAIKRAVNI